MGLLEQRGTIIQNGGAVLNESRIITVGTPAPDSLAAIRLLYTF